MSTQRPQGRRLIDIRMLKTINDGALATIPCEPCKDLGLACYISEDKFGGFIHCCAGCIHSGPSHCKCLVDGCLEPLSEVLNKFGIHVLPEGKLQKGSGRMKFMIEENCIIKRPGIERCYFSTANGGTFTALPSPLEEKMKTAETQSRTKGTMKRSATTNMDATYKKTNLKTEGFPSAQTTMAEYPPPGWPDFLKEAAHNAQREEKTEKKNNVQLNYPNRPLQNNQQKPWYRRSPNQTMAPPASSQRIIAPPVQNTTANFTKTAKENVFKHNTSGYHPSNNKMTQNVQSTNVTTSRPQTTARPPSMTPSFRSQTMDFNAPRSPMYPDYYPEHDSKKRKREYPERRW